MEVLCVLLASALLPLLPPSGASVPTLAPPLTMVVDGQHRQLVVCVVSDVSPGSGDAVWISSGNGSALQSFTYGASPEDGGTVCAVSILPESPPEGGLLACHVGPNSTAPARSSSPVPVIGSGEEAEPCPSAMIGPRACASAALLAAARLVLLKVALLDALLTSALLAQR
ncbi:pre T-cell antigen receptor alpha [Cygnus atratus]|uniref:pre T-cell antigen receptor alpha n=1 Tax=Cygnus atratus TaxID=8868 RepID=UPI0015D5CC58|nr:pre T-cell antigen receptor alpha [Cygnus atratus]